LKNKIHLRVHGNFPYINHDSKKPHLVKDSLTEPAVVCATAGKWGKLTFQSCGLIPLCWRVVIGETSGITKGDQEMSKPQTPRFMNSGTLLFCPRICLLGPNRSKKPAQHRHVSRFQTRYPGPVLANVGPDCNPCDKPLNLIMQSKKKKGLTFWYINVSLDEQLKWYNFLSFTSQTYYLFNKKKINAQTSPWEQGPHKNGGWVHQICPIGLMLVLFYLLRLWSKKKYHSPYSIQLQFFTFLVVLNFNFKRKSLFSKHSNMCILCIFNRQMSVTWNKITNHYLTSSPLLLTSRYCI